MEEVARFSVFFMCFLEEKHEFPLLERLQPLIPAHMLQLLPTHSLENRRWSTPKMVTMLCAWYSRRKRALSLLRPVLDHFWILRRERLPPGDPRARSGLLIHFACSVVGDSLPAYFSRNSFLFWREDFSALIS